MKKILLVDDDQNLCTLLSSYLISFNLSVNSVNTIRNALVYMREDCPDLVISDIMMQGFDGYDFIRLLKLNSLYIHIPIIFLTAKGMTTDRIMGYNLGCHAYLTKPFDPQELVAIINNIFNQINLFRKSAVVNHRKLLVNSKLFNVFSLTQREQNVLMLVIDGYMNKEIAINLGVSQRSIEQYVSRLLSKTNARNRVELIKLFLVYV
uniref:hypothetical protein Ycf29 n=1 Tax=Aphanocladia delicatula TaxID=3041656 RepID=UPI0025520608|nr:hypothetical protein Ycf29 [Aphanocladia delicatula]WGH14165.1 hypothetical protein Ycf29 [Aphanocladia delicatula]